MKIKLISFSIVLLSAMWFAYPVVAQDTDNTKAQPQRLAVAAKPMAKDWEAVKSQYPTIAMEHVRIKALARGLTILIAEQQMDTRRGAATQLLAMCDLYRQLGVSQPEECRIDELGPFGNIGDCFRPQPDSDGGYSNPTASEAAACVQSALRPQ